MKVKILKDHSAGLKAGNIHDVPDHVAAGLVSEHIAELVKEDKEPAKRSTKEEKQTKQTK